MYVLCGLSIIINTWINIFDVLQFINRKVIHWIVKVSWKTLTMTLVVFASFLLSGMTKYYRLILKIFFLKLEASYQQGVLVCFSGKQYLKTTVLVLGVLISTGLVTVSRCFQRTELNTQRHTQIPEKIRYNEFSINKIQWYSEFIVTDNCKLNSGLQIIIHLYHLTSVSFPCGTFLFSMTP